MTGPGPVITDEIIDHLTGEVMIIVSVRIDDVRASIARSTGAAYDPKTGHVTLFVSKTQWPQTAASALAGKPVAATFTLPDSYISYQIKGRIVSTEPASEAEVLSAKAYMDRTLSVMNRLGVTRLQLSHTFTDADLLAISFQPSEIFIQTPGPQAGVSLTQVNP